MWPGIEGVTCWVALGRLEREQVRLVFLVEGDEGWEAALAGQRASLATGLRTISGQSAAGGLLPNRCHRRFERYVVFVFKIGNSHGVTLVGRLFDRIDG